MAIKKTSKKKVSKKKSTRKVVMPIEAVIEIVAAQSIISPVCKEAVVNYNAAMRSLAAVNKKVIAFTGRFEKSLTNVEKAKTAKQKALAKQRLATSRIAKAEVIADAKAKTKTANDAEKVLRALASLYNTSLARFQKSFARNAAAKAKALKPKRRRVSKKKAVKK
jgi:hypothetical protein